MQRTPPGNPADAAPDAPGTAGSGADAAVSDLIAINVLLEPDAATKVLAAGLNAELRRGLATSPAPDASGAASDASGADGESGGPFAFDETHLPHVTLVQRYVRRADLERVLAAVGEAAAGAEGEDLRLRAGDLGGGELGTPPGTVLASVEFEHSPAVRALHDAVVRALAPFAAVGGSAEAFLALPGEPPANTAIIAYVEEFVPAHAGEHYAPHLSVGVARKADVRRLARTHPLAGAQVAPVAVAAAHLGDLGTAREVLGRWPLLRTQVG